MNIFKQGCQKMGSFITMMTNWVSHILFLRKRVLIVYLAVGEQWLGGRVLDPRPRGREFEPHRRRHCVVVLEQDTFILA